MTDLLSFRLHQLASLSALSAAMRYERKFKLSALEWRSIGMLGSFAPLSLKELARLAGLDKSYASRVVSSLIERGWVSSARSDADGRGVALSLTKAGQALYDRVFPDAAARSEKMLEAFTPAQRRQLDQLLTLLNVGARKLLEEERRAANGDVLPDDEVLSHMPATATASHTRARGAGTAKAVKNSGKLAEPAPTPAPSTRADLDEMRYLVKRMGQLMSHLER